MIRAMPAIDVGGAELFHEQSGSGPDIVWLAAGDNPGSNWRRYQTPAFDADYRSTTYDARGVGRTRSTAPVMIARLRSSRSTARPSAARRAVISASAWLR